MIEAKPPSAMMLHVTERAVASMADIPSEFWNDLWLRFKHVAPHVRDRASFALVMICTFCAVSTAGEAFILYPLQGVLSYFISWSRLPLVFNFIRCLLWCFVLTFLLAVGDIYQYCFNESSMVANHPSPTCVHPRSSNSHLAFVVSTFPISIAYFISTYDRWKFAWTNVVVLPWLATTGKT